MLVFRALILSLAVHLILMAFIQYAPPNWLENPFKSETTAVEIEFLESQNSMQIVRDAEVPEKMKDEASKEKARFLSANDQRVLVETQAKKTGLTQNSRSRPLPKDSWLRKYNQEKIQKINEEQKPSKHAMNGYEPIQLPSAKNASSLGFEGAAATTGELLPKDVALGEFTALNTDRFKYYSFYARIEELVRFRWEQGLKYAIDHIPLNQVLHLNRDVWNTKIEFWLTNEGHFHSAHIHNESGIKRFDRAAVFAFQDARVFPNPPPELIGDDGLIRIQYSFTVRWSPKSLVGR